MATVDAIWDGYVNGDWNTIGTTNGWNWNTPNYGMSTVVPTGTATVPGINTIVYNKDLTFSAPLTTIQNIVFQNPLQAYTFTIQTKAGTPKNELDITGTGLSNANGENFFSQSQGILRFMNVASADQSTITAQSAELVFFKDNSTLSKATLNINANGFAAFDGSASAAKGTIFATGGKFEFNDTSTAASSYITLSADNSYLFFEDRSTAGASIINLIGDASSSLNSFVVFEATSQAGTSKIRNAGTVVFRANSSAQYASITNSDTGYVTFLNASVGGHATIVNGTGCVVDLSQHSAGQFDIGSISGPGKTVLGAGVYVHFTGAIPGTVTGHAVSGDSAAAASAVLITPSLTTNISGAISGAGGVMMDSSGTLTLSGANTYTGDTSVANGTIELATGGSIAGALAFQGLAWGPAIIKLDAANQFSGTIKGMARGDAVDLAYHAFSASDHVTWTQNAANSGGTLSIGTGATQVALNLAGAFTPNLFSLTNDGNGGTLITDLGTTQTVSQGLSTIAANPAFGRIDFADTATNVLTGIDSLGNIAGNVASINFTDGATPVFNLTAAQSVADHAAIMAIATSASLQVTATSSGLNKLMGGHGNDTLTGSAGLNTAVFTGISSDYTMTTSGSSTMVADTIAHRDGADTLNGIQRIQFQDQILAFDLNGDAGQTYRMYQAAFARTPDTAGVSYWVSQVDQGLSLTDLAQNFIGSAEFQSIYGASPTASAIVTGFYTNVLGRAPDASGLSYWLGVLQSGTSEANLLVSFSESAENQAIVAPVIASGISLAPSYFS